MDTDEARRKLAAKEYIERLRQEIASLTDDNAALEALLVVDAEHEQGNTE